MSPPKRNKLEAEAVSNRSEENNSSKKSDKYAKTNSLSEIVEKELGRNVKKKTNLRRINFSLTPELRAEFESHATELDMSLTEFLRRAGRAAARNHELLSEPEIEKAEADYKGVIGPSRWTRKPE